MSSLDLSPISEWDGQDRLQGCWEEDVEQPPLGAQTCWLPALSLEAPAAAAPDVAFQGTHRAHALTHHLELTLEILWAPRTITFEPQVSAPPRRIVETHTHTHCTMSRSRCYPPVRLCAEPLWLRPRPGAGLEGRGCSGLWGHLRPAQRAGGAPLCQPRIPGPHVGHVPGHSSVKSAMVAVFTQR